MTDAQVRRRTLGEGRARSAVPGRTAERAGAHTAHPGFAPYLTPGVWVLFFPPTPFVIGVALAMDDSKRLQGSHIVREQLSEPPSAAA